MIRPATPADTAAIIDIWLAASRQAHDFIPYEFWQDRAEDMEKLYLPQAESHVIAQHGQISAFLSLVDHHLAALFVRPERQGEGLGRRLMAHAQELRPQLSLCVYSQNARAVQFYRAAGFRVLEERLDPQTRHPELLMHWARPDAD